MDTKHTLQKRESYKGDLLLGHDADGDLIWLRPASWDCGWYWGYGYIGNAHFHTHVDSELMGMGKHDKAGEYCHNIYNAKLLVETTFSEAEGWQLSELFKRFYTLRAAADLFTNGTAGISSAQNNDKHPDIAHLINQLYIPDVIAQITKILTP